MGTTLLLSDILKSTHQFSFFHELINLKQLENTTSEFLLKYDLIKIESTIADIKSYLSSLLEVFFQIANADITDKNSVSWIFEVKTEVLEVVRNLESIDDIISQLLILLENKVNSKNKDENIHFVKTLEKIDQINDLSLRAKKFSIVYKKRLDISVAYDELESQIIRGIDYELNECLKQSFKIIEIRATSPYKRVPKYNLEVLNKKLNANNTRTLKLPIFNEIDMSLYDAYLALDERVKPLNMSLEFVPQALENFKHTARDLYPDLIQNLVVKYNGLKEKLGFLNNDIKNLKNELVDARWNEIFTFLISETNFLLKDVEEELELQPLKKVTKALNYKISIMDQTLAVLNKASKLGLLKKEPMKDEFISITKKWNKTRGGINNIERETEELEDDEKLKVLSTIKKNNDSYEVAPNFMRKSKDVSHTHSESPSKISRRKAIGASIAGSLSLHPIYITSTPAEPSLDGRMMIDRNELKSLKNSAITEKLMQEASEEDGEGDTLSSLNSLTTGLANLKIDPTKKLLPELSPIKEATSPNNEADQSLKSLIHNNKETKSKIPIPTQKRHSHSSTPTSSTFKTPLPRSRPVSLVSTSSMIPRPTSRSTSRLTSRSSSRASSRCSNDSENSENESQMTKKRTSVSSLTRLNLGNITNVTNNGTAHSTPIRNTKRSSMLPTPVKGAFRRPASSLGKAVSVYRRTSTTSDEYF